MADALESLESGGTIRREIGWARREHAEINQPSTEGSVSRTDFVHANLELRQRRALRVRHIVRRAPEKHAGQSRCREDCADFFGQREKPLAHSYAPDSRRAIARIVSLVLQIQNSNLNLGSIAGSPKTRNAAVATIRGLVFVNASTAARQVIVPSDLTGNVGLALEGRIVGWKVNTVVSARRHIA